MVLEVEAEITIDTRIGQSVIQLLIGDITDLPVNDKVDIIFTSAIPGAYGAGNKETLFYSLKSNLGISVNDLAKDKFWDGRKDFFCWCSQKLPEDKPFSRLACLEVPGADNMFAHISALFRATVPIFNGKESTIITPLLGTGCQGFVQKEMMKNMVICAYHLIKAGQPLRCMKLVLFCKNIERARQFQQAKSIKLFKHLKAEFEEKKVENESYDVTLCFHDQDKELMRKIQSTFLKVDNSLKIHSDIFIKKDLWRDETFKVLANSKRIVIVLTQAYVTDKWCQEQFNMGLCCNRRYGEEVVIPFKMECDVTDVTLPSYMGLVQYKDCSVKNSGENDEDKLTDACSEVIGAVKNSNVVTSAQCESLAPVYDVFISYCHQTSEFAKIAFKILKEKYPNFNVFFDEAELKTGNSWQPALYDALDLTHCVIAFLSDPYMESLVCQEELNIALARKKAKDNFLLVPVCLPELSRVPASLISISPFKIISSEEIEGLIYKIMSTVEKIVSGEEEKMKLDVVNVRNIQILNRKQDFKKKFTVDATKQLVSLVEISKASFDMERKITFAYGSEELKLVASLCEILRQEFPKITAKFLNWNQTETRNEIDSADIVVIFVSDEFLKAEHHVEELHIALCRQRVITDSTVVYLVEADHQDPNPFFTHILPYNVRMGDDIWETCAKSFDVKAHPYVVKTPGIEGTYNCSAAEHLALMKMKFDIVELLSQRGQGSSVQALLVNIFKMEFLNEGEKDRKRSISELPSVASFYPHVILNSPEHSAKNYCKESENLDGKKLLHYNSTIKSVRVTNQKTEGEKTNKDSSTRSSPFKFGCILT